MSKMPLLPCALRILRNCNIGHINYHTTMFTSLYYWLAITMILMSSATAEHIYPPGVVRPKKTEVAVGESFNLTCEVTDGIDVSTIYFQIDKKQVINQTSSMLKVINDHTVVLTIHNAKEQMSSYECYSGLNVIEKADVYVGSPPLSVTDLNCIWEDFEIVKCYFNKPYNSIPTQYTLINFKCTKNSTYYSCNLDEQLPRNDPFHNFIINASNALGNTTFNYTIEMHKIVRATLKNLENFRITNVTTNSIDIEWFFNSNILYLDNTDGLLYEMSVKPKYFDEIIYRPEITATGNNNFKTTLAVPYAYHDYTLAVRIKANTSRDDLWSDWKNVTFQTMSKIPDRPPQTANGSYYIRNFETELHLYWKKLNDSEYNGKNFHYTIKQIDENGNIVTTKNTKSSTIKFPRNNVNKIYDFYIKSANDIGESADSSIIRVYPLVKNYNIILTVYDSNENTLTWNSPKNIDDLINYTVFYCLTDTHSLTQCKGSIDYAYINDTHATSFKSDKLDENHYFAISANFRNYTTGMQWQKCSNNIGPELKKPDLEIVTLNATALQVLWNTKFICGYNYTLVYCETENNCFNKTSIPHDKQSLILGNLKPYTHYTIELIMTSKEKFLSSDKYSSTTREAAPTPPRQLLFNDTSITSNSILISWLPPDTLNGILRSYTISYWQSESEDLNTNESYVLPIDDDNFDISNKTVYHNMTNLQSDTAYEVWIQAYTVDFSQSSNKINFHTLIGTPSEPEKLTIPATNEALEWERPNNIQMNRDVYYIVTLLQYSKNETKGTIKKVSLVDSNNCRFQETTCYDTQFNYRLKVRALTYAHKDEIDSTANPIANINNITEGYVIENALCTNGISAPTDIEETQLIVYSQWAEYSYPNNCITDSSQVIFICFAMLILIIGLLFAINWIQKKFQKMKNIDIILPEGLMNIPTTKYDNNLNPYVNNNSDLETPDKTCENNDCFNFNQHDNTNLLNLIPNGLPKIAKLTAATTIVTPNFCIEANDNSKQENEKTSSNTTSSLISHNSDACSINSSEHDDTEYLVELNDPNVTPQNGDYVTEARFKNMSALAMPSGTEHNTNTFPAAAFQMTASGYIPNAFMMSAMAPPLPNVQPNLTNGYIKLDAKGIPMLPTLAPNASKDYIQLDPFGKPMLPPLAPNNLSNDGVALFDLHRKPFIPDATSTKTMPSTTATETDEATSDMKQLSTRATTIKNDEPIASHLPSAILYNNNSNSNNHNNTNNTNNTTNNLHSNINGYVTQRQLAEFGHLQQ